MRRREKRELDGVKGALIALVKSAGPFRFNKLTCSVYDTKHNGRSEGSTAAFCGFEPFSDSTREWGGGYG